MQSIGSAGFGMTINDQIKETSLSVNAVALRVYAHLDYRVNKDGPILKKKTPPLCCCYQYGYTRYDALDTGLLAQSDSRHAKSRISRPVTARS